MQSRHTPIRTPLLHLIGEREAIAYSRACESLGDSRTSIVPNAGHFLHLEQPQLAARAALDWLTLSFTHGVDPTTATATPNPAPSESAMPATAPEQPLSPRTRIQRIG